MFKVGDRVFWKANRADRIINYSEWSADAEAGFGVVTWIVDENSCITEVGVKLDGISYLQAVHPSTLTKIEEIA